MSARALQIAASVLVALAIVAVTIVVVSAQIGPNAGDDDKSGHGRGRSGERR